MFTVFFADLERDLELFGVFYLRCTGDWVLQTPSEILFFTLSNLLSSMSLSYFTASNSSRILSSIPFLMGVETIY